MGKKVVITKGYVTVTVGSEVIVEEVEERHMKKEDWNAELLQKKKKAAEAYKKKKKAKVKR